MEKGGTLYVAAEGTSYPLQVLYLFVDGMLMMGLGIVFTFSPIVFYSPYAAAPRLWGISAGPPNDTSHG